MVALFNAAVSEPGVPGDEGVRYRQSATGRTAGGGRFSVRPSAAARVAGQGLRVRYLRVTADVVRVDLQSEPGVPGVVVGHDLTPDARSAWRAALRHDQTGDVYGPWSFAADADLTDPYSMPIAPAAGAALIAAGLLRDQTFTVLIFDPRVRGGVLLAHAGDRLLAGAESAAQRLRDALLVARGSYPASRGYGSTIGVALDRSLDSAGGGALAAAVADAVAHTPNGLSDVRLRSVRATADDGVVTLDVQADWVSRAGALTPISLREQLG